MKSSAFAKQIRLDVLRMTMEKKAGFIGTAFSCADILAVLYCDFLRYGSGENDVLILSKGHGASAWYAALAGCGVISREALFEQFNKSGYNMGLHPKRGSFPGIITSSGSLGQGLGQGCGIALADKAQGRDRWVYALLGDGECNEGSVWESLMLASRYSLDRLCVIIDRNRLQSYGHDVLNMGDMAAKIASFGLRAVTVDGHDCDALTEAFNDARKHTGPFAIVANTIKGKGASEFEDKVLWHYKWPEGEIYDAAKKELEA